MMEEGATPSLASVVQDIMETLSDAVNQLILLVIALQEQNSAMPAHIPPATEAVASAANTLTSIARDLANDEYEDYEDIQGEIIQACDEMDSSAQGLIKAVQNIQKTNDRKAGWEGLLDASKIISGKTIRILEIVYGAEIKRLLFTAEQTAKLVAETDASQAAKNPEAFAQHIGELASKAGELASQVTNKAADEEAPLSRANLERTGDDLRERSERIVTLANDLLESPSDSTKKKKFEDEVKALEKGMHAATAPMKEKLSEITRSNIENVFQNMTAEPPVAAGKDAQQTGPAPSTLSKRSSVAVGSLGSPTVAALVGENAGIADVARAAIRRDAAGVATAAQAIAARTEELVEKLKDSAQKLDPEAKSNIQGAIARLQKNVKDEAAASAEVSKNPGKKDAREKLTAALNKLDEDVIFITDSVVVANPDKLQIYARKEQALLDVLGEAVHASDPNAVVEAIKNLVACQQKLIPLAIAEAQRAPTPERQATMARAAQDLGSLLPRQVQAAKAALEDKSEPNLANNEQISDKMNDAIDALLGATSSRASSASGAAKGSVPEALRDSADSVRAQAKKQKELGAKLAEASAKGDIKGVERVLKDMSDGHRAPANKARTAAEKIQDPRAKDRVLAALNDLDSLLPLQAQAAHDLAKAPKDPAKKALLDQVSQRIGDDFAELARDLESAAEWDASGSRERPLNDEVGKLHDAAIRAAKDVAKAAHSPNGVHEVPKAAKESSAAQSKLAPKAIAAAENSPVPFADHHVKRALDSIRNDLHPRQEATAHKVAQDPTDEAQKGALRDATTAVVAALDSIKYNLTGSTPAKTHGGEPSAVDPELEHLLEKVREDAKRIEAAKSPQDVASAAKDAKESHARLAPKAHAAARRSQAPNAEPEVQRALDKLQHDLLPKQEELAQKVAQSPTDNTKRDELKAATDHISHMLDAIRNAITGAPEAIRDAALDARGHSQKAKELGAKLSDAGAKGDTKAVDQTLKDIHDVHAPLAADAWGVVGKIHDPIHQHHVLDALNDLDALLPQQEKAARDLAHNPRDAQKKGKLEELNRDIARDFDIVSDALADAASAHTQPATSVDPAVVRLAEREKELAHQVAAAALATPAGDVPHAARNLAQAHVHFAPEVISAAKNSPNPTAEPYVRRLLDRLEKESLPKQEAVAKEVAKDQSNPAKKDELSEATNNIGNSVDDILTAIGGLSAQQAAKDSAVKTHAQAKKQKALGAQLATAAAKGDLKAVAQAVKDISDNYAPLKSRAKRAAQQSDDPKAAQRALKSLKDLDDLLSQQAKAGHALAHAPKDASKKSQLDDINDSIARELDSLTDALADAAHTDPTGPDADLDALLRKAQDEAHGVAGSAAKAAGQEVDRATRDVKDTYAKLAPKAKAAARSSPHAFAEPRVAHALHELQYYLMPQQEELAQKVAQNPKDEAKKAQLKDVTDKIYDSLDDIRDALTGEGATPEAARDNAIAAKSQSKKARELGRKLADAGAKGDPKAVEQAIKDIHSTHQPLASKARKAAQKLPHNEKDRVLAALADLDALLPEQAAAARDLARTPHDAGKRAKLDDVNRQIGRNLESVADALAADNGGAQAGPHAVDPEINKLITKEKAGVSKAEDAAVKAAPQDTAHALKDIKDTHAQLAPKASAAAKKLPNPADQHHIQKALDHLTNDLLPKHEELATHVAKGGKGGDAGGTDSKDHPNDEAKKGELQAVGEKIKDELDVIRDALKGTPSAAALKDAASNAKSQAKKAKEASAKLTAAGAKGDKRGVEQALKDVKDSHLPIKSKSKSLAARAPPDQSLPILNAVAELDSLLPQQEQAARDLARTPRDGAKKSKLEGLNNQIGKNFDFLSDALAAAAAAAISEMDDPYLQASGSAHLDPELQQLINKAKEDARNAEAVAFKPAPSAPEAAKWAKEARDTHAQLAPRALAAAASSPFPHADAHVKKTVAALRNELVPKQEEAIKAALSEPKSNAKKDDVKAVTKKINDALDSIVDALSGGGAVPQGVKDASGDVKTRANKAKELGGKLSDAGGKGDAKAVDQALRDIKDTQGPLLSKSRAAAAQLPPQSKQRVLDALADLDALLPQQEAAARDLVHNPRDATKKSKLDALNKQIAKDLDVVNSELATHGPSRASADEPDKMRKKTQKPQVLSAKLVAAAAAGDKGAVDQALRDLGAARDELHAEARSAPAHDAQRVAQALADLDALLPTQAAAARDAAAAPRDKQKKQTLQKVNERIADRLDDLAALLGDDAVKDELEALIQQQRDKTAEVLAAATDPNHSPHTQPKTEAATKANNDVFTKLSPKVKSTPLNPPAKRTADKALEDLGVLIPAQAYLATSAAAHPTHGVQPMALRDTTNHIQEALSALSGALATDALAKEAAQAQAEIARLVDAVNGKHADKIPPLLLHAVTAISSPPSRLLPLARRVAQHLSDPETKQKLLAVVGEAETEFPRIVEALQGELSGDVKEKLGSAKGTAPLRELENAQKLIARIAALGVPSATEESVALGDKASDALSDLLDAAKKGDAAGVEKAAERLAALQPKLIRTARTAADTLSDPNRKKKLFGAIDELGRPNNQSADDFLPAVVSAARDVASHPHDAQALDKLDKAGAKADKTINKIVDDSGLAPLANADKLLDDLDQILAASARSDPEEMMQAVKDFVKHQPDFSEAARVQADGLGDRGHKIRDPVAKLDGEVKALLNAAHEVIKDPNSEVPKKKLAKSVGDVRAAVVATSDAIRNAPPPAFSVAPQADELTALVPALIAAAEIARDNPQDEAAQQRLADALEKLSKPLEDYLDENASPADQAAACADAMTDGLNAIVQAAIRGDLPQVEKATKDLGAKQATFAEKTKQVAAKLKSPERKAQANGAVDDVGHLVPELVALAKQVAQNPKDQPTLKKLQNLNRVANDGLNLAKNAVRHKRAVKDANAPEKADRRLKLCGTRNNTPQEDAEAVRRLRGTVRQLDALVKDEAPDWLKGRKIGDAIADLEKKLHEKHGSNWPDLPPKNGSPSAAQGTARGAASPSIAGRVAAANKAGAAPSGEKGLEDAKKRVEAEIDLVRKRKHTPLQASVHDAGDAIRKLRIAAFRGDPQRVATETKAALGKQGRVAELAKLFAAQATNPALKKKVEDAARDLDQLLPQQDVLAKAAAQNKGDPKHWDALDDATVKAEAAIAQIGEAVNPTPESAIVALAKKSKAEVPRLLEAAKAGDTKATEAALKNIEDLNRKLGDSARQEVAKSGNAEKARELDESLQELAATSANLASALKEKGNHDKLATVAKALYDPLDTIASIVTEKDDLQEGAEEGRGEAKQEEAKKQAKVFLATLKPKKGAKINPNHLIKASQHLAGLMEDLVGKTKQEAHSQKEKGNLTERAKAALELDDLLSSMEASAKVSAKRRTTSSLSSSSSISARPAAIQSLESVLANLTAIASTVPQQLAPITSSPSLRSSSSLSSSQGVSSSKAAASPAKPSGSLSDSIIKIAKGIQQPKNDIQTRAGTDTDPVSVVNRDLAAELQRFAKADQERRRQDMLISGRAIGTHITRLVAEIKLVAGQCKDPVLQDKLLKHAQTLRNMGIQLKILASVKAASSDDSSNNSQLAGLTQALGNILSDVNTTLTIIKKSKKM